MKVSYKLKLRIGSILLLLLILASVAMIMFGFLPGESLIWGEIQNTGHTILFVFITLAFIGLLRYALPPIRNKSIAAYVITFLALVTVAALTELGQQLTNREPSLADVVRDIAGVLIGLGLFAFADSRLVLVTRRHYRKFRTGTLVFSAVLLVTSLWPLIHLSHAYVERNQAFPVIVDFQNDWARSFLEVNNAVLTRAAAPEGLLKGGASGDERVALLNLNAGDFPGIVIVEPYPDWSAYKVLEIDLFFPHSKNMNVMLRIHDKDHNQEYTDRFNRLLELEPGHNNFQIPLRNVEHAPVNRKMNMQQISGLVLFASNMDNSLDMYPRVMRLR